eukprot:CAMPEP_0174345652 /NCGR_PEP_ID=MMETSP0811_2-20130205/1159_1 /TAXON_ID=73025 ORGANISM="Eutreptiella gymnastica-like, Strain CCMP1594" /NCGR_SAMPLE_ID=MMETSP0811_2 /ASSEMBLY_ACC=CAM_ASM_000667 /LENGTH=68 /DNA_ID=CAMNT_0015469543 /DNA_START=300 /DNA_END=503 /DNA_ORIENTATION=+
MGAGLWPLLHRPQPQRRPRQTNGAPSQWTERAGAHFDETGSTATVQPPRHLFVSDEGSKGLTSRSVTR